MIISTSYFYSVHISIPVVKGSIKKKTLKALLGNGAVCCTILSVERCSLGNTSLHRDEMTPLLQEYSSAPLPKSDF